MLLMNHRTRCIVVAVAACAFLMSSGSLAQEGPDIADPGEQLTFQEKLAAAKAQADALKVQVAAVEVTALLSAKDATEAQWNAAFDALLDLQTQCLIFGVPGAALSTRRFNARVVIEDYVRVALLRETEPYRLCRLLEKMALLDDMHITAAIDCCSHEDQKVRAAAIAVVERLRLGMNEAHIARLIYSDAWKFPEISKRLPELLYETAGIPTLGYADTQHEWQEWWEQQTGYSVVYTATSGLARRDELGAPPPDFFLLQIFYRLASGSNTPAYSKDYVSSLLLSELSRRSDLWPKIVALLPLLDEERDSPGSLLALYQIAVDPTENVAQREHALFALGSQWLKYSREAREAADFYVKDSEAPMDLRLRATWVLHGFIRFDEDLKKRILPLWLSVLQNVDAEGDRHKLVLDMSRDAFARGDRQTREETVEMLQKALDEAGE